MHQNILNLHLIDKRKDLVLCFLEKKLIEWVDQTNESQKLSILNF